MYETLQNSRDSNKTDSQICKQISLVSSCGLQTWNPRFRTFYTFSLFIHLRTTWNEWKLTKINENVWNESYLVNFAENGEMRIFLWTVTSTETREYIVPLYLPFIGMQMKTTYNHLHIWKKCKKIKLSRSGPKKKKHIYLVNLAESGEICIFF